MPKSAEEKLIEEGWQKMAIYDEPRLSEMTAMYAEIGLEVHLSGWKFIWSRLMPQMKRAVPAACRCFPNNLRRSMSAKNPNLMDRLKFKNQMEIVRKKD